MTRCQWWSQSVFVPRNAPAETWGTGRVCAICKWVSFSCSHAWPTPITLADHMLENQLTAIKKKHPLSHISQDAFWETLSEHLECRTIRDDNDCKPKSERASCCSSAFWSVETAVGGKNWYFLPVILFNVGLLCCICSGSISSWYHSYSQDPTRSI